ncbi:MAG: hypothetical protein Q7T77_02205 [Sulfuricurvum sp.]|nr:hypothetical protein [Sulfuricurvum sp.]
MYSLVNYASIFFQEKQKKNTDTGLSIGGFSKVFSFSLQDINSDFYEKNKNILILKKGEGYWLWKPYFILKVLESLNEEDYLFYCDSGAYFIDSINSTIELSKELNQDIITFHTDYLEKQYTKRDAFILMNCDTPHFTDTKQSVATMHLWKKTDFSINFLKEWLLFAQDQRILTDIHNTLGEPNYPEFVAHRNDQSIFSLLCKKYNLQAFPEPTQFGNIERQKLQNPYLKQFLHHTKGDRIKRTIIQKIIHELTRPFKPKKLY